MHLASPEQVVSGSQIKIKNLFHKAIIQSAGCLQKIPTVIEAQSKDSIGAQILGMLCPPDKYSTNESVLACMRRQKVADILTAQGKYSQEEIKSFSPVAGTTTMPNKTVPTQFESATKMIGGLIDVPMIIGGTRDEMSLYIGYLWQNRAHKPINASTIDNWLRSFYGALSETKISGIKKIYPDLNNSDDTKVAASLGSILSHYNPKIGLNNCLYLHTSDVILNTPGRKNKSIFQFEFADIRAPVCRVGISEPCPPFLKNGGAVHSSELNYLFPNLSNTSAIDAPDLEPASQVLANQMINYWASFAYTGSPKATGLPLWPEYKGAIKPFGGNSVMLLSPNNVHDYDADEYHSCNAFWLTEFAFP